MPGDSFPPVYRRRLGRHPCPDPRARTKPALAGWELGDREKTCVIGAPGSNRERRHRRGETEQTGQAAAWAKFIVFCETPRKHHAGSGPYEPPVAPGPASGPNLCAPFGAAVAIDMRHDEA